MGKFSGQLEALPKEPLSIHRAEPTASVTIRFFNQTDSSRPLPKWRRTEKLMRWRRRRSRRCPRSTGSRSWTACRGANLVADFLNPRAADFIQHSNYVTMTRHTLGADGNFDVRIRFVQSVEARHDLFVLNVLAVETDGVARADADGNRS